MKIVLYFILLLFSQVQAQTIYGKWYILDFMRARAGEIYGTDFLKDSIHHFMTDPFISGTYIYDHKFKAEYFDWGNFQIAMQRDVNNAIYVIVIKSVNGFKKEIFIPEKHFFSVAEVKEYLKNKNWYEASFIPIYSEAYIRSLPTSLKPFHQITADEFYEVMNSTFADFNAYIKKNQNHKSLKVNKLINGIISVNLIRKGYCPFPVYFPDEFLKNPKLMRQSEQLDSLSKLW